MRAAGLIYASGRSQPLFEVICLFLKHAVTGSENSELDATLDNLWTALAIALRGYSVRSDVVCNQIVDNAFRTALTTTSCIDIMK